MKKKHTVLMVDDHLILRQALVTYFEGYDHFSVIDEAENGVVALNLLKKKKYDLIITDINMPAMDGMELMRQIRETDTSQKIIALTMLSERHYIKEMLGLGVNGYILKNCGKSEFFRAVDEVLADNNYYSQKVVNTLVDVISKKTTPSKRLTYEKKLTERELEIIQLVVEDKSNREIADQLFISERTVGTHKRNIMEKTGCKNLAGLAVYAIEEGIIKLDR